MDCSLLGSPVHGILQARILAWIAVPFSRKSSWPRDGTQVSCITGRVFTLWATRHQTKRSLERLLVRYGKLSSGHRTGDQFPFQSQNPSTKECSNYHTIALISQASKVMPKILQGRPQQHMNQKLSDVQVGFIKGRGTRNQIANIRWIIKKARGFQKNIYFCSIYWLHQSLWLCGPQQTVENSETDGNTRPLYFPPEKSVCRSRSNS